MEGENRQLESERKIVEILLRGNFDIDLVLIASIWDIGMGS